jgi:hypothetical protein
MNEKFLLLTRAIQHDLQAIEKTYDLMGTPNLTDESGEEKFIVLAYRLHGLYNAFENIFQNIAATFENSLDDSAHWHSQLLQRMCLDMMPVRPAVINDTTYDLLDELRRFRHLFRYAYDIELDGQRLQLVLSKALQLKLVYHAQIEQFLGFLRGLQTENLT